MVFTKLSKEWVNQFTEFGMVVKDTIIPSCFLGPSSPHFDLKDAQCQMAIVESANCMKELFNLSGEGLIIYLRDEYMRQSLQCNNEIIDEYLQALTSKDIKGMGFYILHFESSIEIALRALRLQLMTFSKNIENLWKAFRSYTKVFFGRTARVWCHIQCHRCRHISFLLFLHIIRLLTLSVFAFAAMQVFRLTLLVHVVFTDTFLTHPFTCQNRQMTCCP